MDSDFHIIYGGMWNVTSPHGLRFMALRSWRTLIGMIEAPKSQRSQRAYKEEIII